MCDPIKCYVRFVVDDKKRSLGVIRAAARIQRQLRGSDNIELEKLFDWFNTYLDIPSKFTRSKNTCGKAVALSWFKDTAKSHIAKARKIVNLLERNNVRTKMLTSRKPGYVLYEDEYQIVAVPFAETEK